MNYFYHGVAVITGLSMIAIGVCSSNTKPYKPMENTENKEHNVYINPTIAPTSIQLTPSCLKFKDLNETSINESFQIDFLNSKIEQEKKDMVYEKPKYNGAFALSGTFRQVYYDENKGSGIIVELNDNSFVFVLGSGCVNTFGGNCVPGIWFDGGYVEDAQELIHLNIGRNGRNALVVKSRDIETFRDDQKKYQEEIIAAKNKSIESQKQYNIDVVNIKKLKTQHEKTLKLVATQKILCK